LHRPKLGASAQIPQPNATSTSTVTRATLALAADDRRQVDAELALPCRAWQATM
jgi:hypothetical protein